MPDCMWTEEKTASWMWEQELIRTLRKSMVEKYCPKLLEYYARIFALGSFSRSVRGGRSTAQLLRALVELIQ